jgi:hypothetical protein
MFGAKKKKMNVMVEELLDIVTINHENVNTMKEALEHLGEAVKNMHELVLVIEARLVLLESKEEDK